MNEQENNRGEWLKFIVLMVILIGTVLVIALLRPLIFGKIVPAVMGEGITLPAQEPVPAPVVTETPAASQPANVTESYPAPATNGETADSNQSFIPVQSEPETAENTAAYPAGPVTPPNAITHIVQPGENLTAIANKYNVTVQSIIDANKLTNPNRVLVGTTLIIIAREP